MVTVIEQPTLDDALEEARRARDEGMEAADLAAPAWWRADVRQSIYKLAATGRPFSVDDVRQQVLPPPASPNAFGPIFAAAAKAGVIRRCGFVESARVEAHRRAVRQWIGVG